MRMRDVRTSYPASFGPQNELQKSSERSSNSAASDERRKRDKDDWDCLRGTDIVVRSNFCQTETLVRLHESVNKRKRHNKP